MSITRKSIKWFAINWICLAVAFIVVASFGIGYNSIDRSFDFFGGLESLFGLFAEGIISVLLVLLIALVAGAIFVGLWFLVGADYFRKPFRRAGAVALVMVAGVAGVVLYDLFHFDWIPWPENGGGSFGVGIGALVFVTVVAAFFTGRTNGPAQGPSNE